MRQIKFSIVLTALLGSSAFAATPTAINFQGILTDTSGVPVADNSYSVTFRIYDNPTGGTTVWTETNSVTTADGLFHVTLGTISPINNGVFASAFRYLGIQVGANPEMSPRTSLVTVPYAFRTASVDGAFGGYVTNSVAIGSGNVFSGFYIFVAGQNNSVLGENSSIAGGHQNSIPSGITNSFIGGGFNNVVSGHNGVVVGGEGNESVTQGSYIGGGFTNVAGSGDPITGPANATVGGGFNNEATEEASFIGGGNRNAASGPISVIAGGMDNIASGNLAFVGGGELNQAVTFHSFVGGGSNNVAGSGVDPSGQEKAVVVGGSQNQALGAFSFIGGGSLNLASGDISAIPGGYSNSATGLASFAAGYRAKAIHSGAFVWGDGTSADVSSTRSNQFTARAVGGARFFTNASLTAGVVLDSGGGSWSSASDVNLKENIEPVDGREILEKLTDMPISSWNYITQDDGIRHIGPMAQDFDNAFGLGSDNRFINTIDADGIALAAAKQLAKENAELKARVEKLEKALKVLLQER